MNRSARRAVAMAASSSLPPAPTTESPTGTVSHPVVNEIERVPLRLDRPNRPASTVDGDQGRSLPRLRVTRCPDPARRSSGASAR
jgi:hypothetical protein